MKLFLLLQLYVLSIACNSKSATQEIAKSGAVNALTASANDSLPKPTKPDTISINAVGDIMFGTNFPNESKMPPNQGKDLLNAFSSYLKDADITFGNAEGVFLNSGGTPKGSGGQVYCFRQPTYMAQYFVDHGFDLLSVANNHVADFGDVGLKSSNEVLSKLPLNYAGFIDKPTTIITVKGLKFGLAAFAPHKGSVNMNDIPNAIKIVKELKKQCHIVMVSFHGGAEGVEKQHVPKKTEIFYGQNRGDVHAFAHKMIDAGADMVIGHGPHVTRAMELYNGKFIAYSLGNFCTYGMFSLGGVSGNAPLLKLYVNEQGNFVKGEIISGKQYGEGGPVLDEDNKDAFNTIKNLTAQDFPNSGLLFENGKILKK
jgi:poly-gamma-glutamate capsule biosynthesis protein CapA/YwtB (metallophosphatase superfamily)